MKRRLASEDEKKLFRKTIDHARPKLTVPVKTRKPPARGKPGGGGLDGNTRKRLQRGARLALVITGKGSPKKEGGGVLKEIVPRWLSQPECAALIAGMEPAHVRDQGAGALYVYLRK